jgi:Flp pilus assembly protein TadB
VSAPKTRKEAYARQKELAKTQKAARSTSATNLTVAQRRELMRQGDPSVLPRRDQGQTRKLARDYVDSRRMASNYLLILFPLIIVGYVIPILQIIVLALFVALLVEWYLTGRRIRALALERFGEAQGGPMTIGFYAGSRAYLPRRWRLPAPRAQLGDDI